MNGRSRSSSVGLTKVVLASLWMVSHWAIWPMGMITAFLLVVLCKQKITARPHWRRGRVRSGLRPLMTSVARSNLRLSTQLKSLAQTLQPQVAPMAHGARLRVLIVARFPGVAACMCPMIIRMLTSGKGREFSSSSRQTPSSCSRWVIR